MARLFIGLGTNQGDRKKYLKQAATACFQQLGKQLAVSPIYETAAWGLTDQPAFLNQVILLETVAPPLACLDIVLAIELKMGRERLEKWGPRNIDIDLLFYDNLTYNDHRLSLPHPYIQDRRFVLQPLFDIAPEFEHPVLGQEISDLLKKCPDTSEVELMAAD